MTAPEVIGQVLAVGAGQVAAAAAKTLGWSAAAAGAGVLWLAVRWRLGSRRRPFPREEAGDDTIAEFGHDLDKEIDELTRRYGDG